MSHPYLQSEDEDVVELGDFSRVLSSRSTKPKHAHAPSCQYGDDGENLSTEFNSDLPEISTVEPAAAKKRPAGLLFKDLGLPRKSNALDRELGRLEAPSPKPNHKEFSERNSQFTVEVIQLLELVSSIEEQHSSVISQFQEAADELKEQLQVRKKRNKNMNVELIRMRRELADRRRELTAVIRVMQSSAGRTIPYHTQQLALPLTVYDRNYYNNQRPQDVSPPQISPVGSKQKNKITLIPQLPSFKNRCGSNKLLMRS